MTGSLKQDLEVSAARRVGEQGVAIVGGGITGATAFGRLVTGGRPSFLFEKARGLGGRLSNRRVTHSATGLSLRVELGAPCFEAFDAELLALCRDIKGFHEFPGEGGASAFCSRDLSRDALSDLVKALVKSSSFIPQAPLKSETSNAGILLQSRVKRVERCSEGSGFRLTWANTAAHAETSSLSSQSFHSVVLTAPFEQAMELLGPSLLSSNITRGTDLKTRTLGEYLQEPFLRYSPCQVVSFLLSCEDVLTEAGEFPIRPLEVHGQTFDRVVLRSLSQLEGPSMGGGKPGDWVLTAYGNPSWSEKARDLPDDRLYAEVIARFSDEKWIRAGASPLSGFRHFWRYSEPTQMSSHSGSDSVVELLPGLWWAGGSDSGRFGVEGAFRAGRLVAQRLLAQGVQGEAPGAV